MRSVAELIAHAKANPGQDQLRFARLRHAAAHDRRDVQAARRNRRRPRAVKGTAASITDMMAGQVQFVFENPSVLVQLVHEGKLKGLATTGETRNPQVPDCRP